MPQPSATFRDELTDVVGELASSERRLRSLHDLAAYEELPADIGNRLTRKANGIEVQRSGLEEILEGKLG